MKKLMLAVLVVGFSLQACSLIGLAPAAPTSTVAPPATLSPTPRPSATTTPTPIPTPTPTPAPEARVAEGDHALFNGDNEAAQVAYSTAFNAAADPAIRAAALLGLGRYHYLTGVYPNALNEFRSVINDYPASPQAADAYYYLAESLFALDRYSEAAEAYGSYLAIRPGVLDAFIDERRGDALQAAGDFAGALAAYTQAVQSPRLPTNFSLELKLAQAYVSLGDYTTALVMYDDIYTRASADSIKAQVDYYQGQMYTSMGAADQATSAYVDAVINYPGEYFSYLGLVELVNAGYPISELQRGLVDYFAGEYGAAMMAFDRYLYYSPEDASIALFYKGWILRDQSDFASAIALWDEIIAGDQAAPKWDAAWEQKAYTQWAYQGDYAGGEQTLLDFVAAAPTHPRAAEFLFDAGRIAERDGRLLDAARDWQRLQAEYAASDYGYRALFLAAICHYRLDDFASAETAFQQAQDIAATPAERAGALFWIGKSQASSGNGAGAQTTWQQAASIDPTGYYSERARDMLNNRSPFTPPQMVDLGIDHQSELRQAELWMQTTFNYPSNTDFSVPGTLAGDPRFIRGQEFWHLGLYDHAEAEFNDLRQEATTDPLISFRLAVYLSDLGMYRQAILSARQVLDLAGLDDAGTLTAPVLFNHIRFGTFFPDLVVPIAQESSFSPLFIWSTLRQESLFDPSIQSSAGAIGLMQIMPVTGEEIVSRLGWPVDYTQDDLQRPQVNLTFGVDYLEWQRETLGGDLYAALAAYNGGPGNAASWQELAKGDPDLFVEIVRLDETRQYLMGIYEVFTIYSRLYARVP